jgi:hypothetical protein
MIPDKVLEILADSPSKSRQTSHSNQAGPAQQSKSRRWISYHSWLELFILVPDIGNHLHLLEKPCWGWLSWRRGRDCHWWQSLSKEDIFAFVKNELFTATFDQIGSPHYATVFTYMEQGCKLNASRLRISRTPDIPIVILPRWTAVCATRYSSRYYLLPSWLI